MKYFVFVSFFSLLFLAIGCSNSSSSEETKTTSGSSTEETQETNDGSKSEQNIRGAIEATFNGPDEKLKEALNGMKNTDIENEEYKKHLNHYAEHFEQHYKPYVTEKFYEASFINSPDADYFIKAAYPDGQLKTEGITIDEKDDYYTFSVKVSYTETTSDESKTIEVRGNAQTIEEEKVNSIHYINSDELYQVIKEIGSTS
ncbi:hypothetical protein [Halobacillus salinus]|uniref:DUF3993 domain-containing protein n=1 Tax=Halobacillus salinus TaxID=192814 RepID=A0A4Z0GWG0_9BACI|nr:hypothetical protein [Halobacillus salinus]TGB01084.1 hypothetical protein E4663_18205 [Halobacillus salinus]